MDTIIELGRGDAVLACRITGLRINADNPMRVLVDVMDPSVIIVVDSDSEADAVQNRARILAEWQDARAGKGMGDG